MQWLIIRKFLTNPIVLGIIAFVLLIGVVYSYGEVQRKEEAGIWKAKIAADEARRAEDVRIADAAKAKYDEANIAAIDDLRAQLEASRAAKVAKVEYITKEVTRYVSKDNDKRSVDSNTFTNGWVRLYNGSITGFGTAPGLPAGNGGNAEAPTGLRASTVAGIAARNNAECEARGEVITAWQEWYGRAKKNYDDYKSWLPGAPGTKATPAATPAPASAPKPQAANDDKFEDPIASKHDFRPGSFLRQRLPKTAEKD